MELEEALDRLYAVGLDEFTPTRNALAKELAATGDAAGARDLKSLRKPNLAAWAINQLARRHPDEVEELFTATDKLRAAQRRVLSGGKPAALREATETRGRIVNQLTKRAGEILAGAGHSAAPATLAAVSASLVAVAAEVEGAELVRKGRLSRELRADALVDVGGLTLVEGEGGREDAPTGAPSAEAAEAAPRDAKAVLAARAAITEARMRVQEARKAAQQAEAEASRRAREADDAERAAKAAREAAEFARRAAEARRSDADAADKALEDARAALRDAEESES